MQDSLTFNKLIILFILNRISFPITTAQISDFILEKEYADFLTLHQSITELTDTEMIRANSVLHRTYLTITEEGEKTLLLFQSRLSYATKQEIKEFFNEKEYELRNEVSILANYYKNTSGDYEAILTAKEKDSTLVKISLAVPTKEMAADICEKWQKNNEEIYQYLVEKLF